MREYLFRGKRTDNGEWAEGYLNYNKTRNQYYIMDDVMAFPIPVHKKSVGEWTGMTEFMLTDESRNAKLFEGDIVEVWGWRSVYGRNQSQYDKRVKVRGVVYFGGRGQWLINYDNKYNEKLAQLKGSETDKRQAHGAYDLYYYGYHGSDIEAYRAKQLEWYGKFHNKEDIYGHDDIVKIGTVYENADLLEG